MVPLYLSVALGLSAVDTGVRLLPLSVTLLVAAVGDPEAVAAGVSRAGWSTGGWWPCSPASSR